MKKFDLFKVAVIALLLWLCYQTYLIHSYQSDTYELIYRLNKTR